MAETVTKFEENYGPVELLTDAPRSRTFRGVHPQLGTGVLIKHLRFGREDASGVFGRVFLDRCEVLSQLAHPYMPALLEAEILANGDGWVAWEWVGGKRLTELAPQPPMQALPLLLHVLEALECLALHNLVHWNVSLENQRLDDKGNARLVGAGVSLLPLEWWYLCRAGVRDESIAPELRVPGAGPVPTVGGAWWRCDLYSFGYAAARLLGARITGAGTATPQVATRPGSATPVDDVLARCLNEDPNRRPNSFAEVMRSLQHSHQRRERGKTESDELDTGKFDIRPSLPENTQPIEVPPPAERPALVSVIEAPEERTTVVAAPLDARLTQPNQAVAAPLASLHPGRSGGPRRVSGAPAGAVAPPLGREVQIAPVADGATALVPLAPETAPPAHSLPRAQETASRPAAATTGVFQTAPLPAGSTANPPPPRAGGRVPSSAAVPVLAPPPPVPPLRRALAHRHRRWLAAALGAIALGGLVVILLRAGRGAEVSDAAPPLAPAPPPVRVEPVVSRAPAPIELVLAQGLFADGDVEGAGRALARLRERDGLLGLPAEHCAAVLSLEEVIEHDRLAAQAAELRRLVEAGQLEPLRGALRAVDGDRNREAKLRVLAGTGAAIDRARAVLARVDRFELELRRGAWGQAFELAAGIARDYPVLERSAGLRERSAKGYERQIEALIENGSGEQARAALLDLRRLSPDRRGLERFDQRLSQQASTRQRYDDLLAEAERILESGRPHEAAELLRATSPPFAYAPRFAETIERMDAEFVRRDAQPPAIAVDEAHTVEFKRGQPLVIRLLISDDYEVTEVRFFGRIGDAPQYRPLEIKRRSGASYEVVVAPAVHQDEPFSYWLLARDRSGHEGRLGSDTAPIEIRRKRRSRG